MAASVPPDHLGMLKVLDRSLEKNAKIDAFTRVSLVGVELLTIEKRVIIASVKAYLKCAERIHEVGLMVAPTT
ncbi:MAG: gas vesicle protein GvpJ [Candidatus Geothermarchaeales archaeon]